MTKLRYVGPHPEVEFSSTGDPARCDYRVAQGDVIDVAGPELVESLLDQPSNWELEKPVKPANDTADAAEETE